MIYGLTTMVLTLATWYFAAKTAVYVFKIISKVKRHA